MKPLATLFFLITWGSQLIACVSDDSYTYPYLKEQSYDFLYPDLIDQAEENPLYKLSGSGYVHSQREEYFQQVKRDLNIKEWQHYLNNRLSYQELENLLYGDEPFLENYQKNYASKVKNDAFDRYLTFVNQQLDKVSGYSDQTISQTLLDESIEKLKAEADTFLRLRYLFLSMRLHHYSGAYEKTLALYETYAPSVEGVDSIVFEWIEALRAGALQHLGKTIASDLLYADILKNNKTNPQLGYYDFHIKDDAEWKALLAQAPNDEEKALFHFMRALKWGNSSLHEHRNIAKLAPNSIWFKRLSYMIMQELQYQAQSLRTRLKSQEKDQQFEIDLKSYEQKKAFFFETIRGIDDPGFFHRYAKVYLEVMDGKALTAEQTQALRKRADAKQQNYVDILVYLDQLRQLKTVDPNAQTPLFDSLQTLLPKLTDAQKEATLRYTASHMRYLYPETSVERILNALYDNRSWDRWFLFQDLNAIAAADFEKFVESKQRSFYEESLFKKSMKLLYKDDVAKILTTLYVQDGDFNQAEHYLKQVPNYKVETEYNPFNVSLANNNREATKQGYTQNKFIITMLTIKATLEKNPESATDHFLYANGLYNRSWFGNFPMSSMLYRTTSDIPDKQLAIVTKQLDEAKAEYLLALQYAQKKEFKAKIAYQLLKIELNKRFLQKASEVRWYYMPVWGEWDGTKNIAKMVNESPELTQALQNFQHEYADTRFGKEIIQSCITFRDFR